MLRQRGATYPCLGIASRRRERTCRSMWRRLRLFADSIVCPHTSSKISRNMATSGLPAFSRMGSLYLWRCV